MGLKEYEHNGLTFQYPEGEQPDGAVLVERSNVKQGAEPKNKARRPATDKNAGVSDPSASE